MSAYISARTIKTESDEYFIAVDDSRTPKQKIILSADEASHLVSALLTELFFADRLRYQQILDDEII